MSKLTIGPINAATPSPLTGDGSFDRESARRLCRRWRELGLNGVLIHGRTGAGLLLPESGRMDFVETALEEAGGNLTIFVSAADQTREPMRERALRYARMGPPCVVLCLTPGVPAQQAINNVKRVADACPVPCAYYEVPANTGIARSLDELRDLMSHPNICAIKDSSNNALPAQALTAPGYRFGGVKLLDGVEYRAAFSAALGYDGVIHGGGVLTGRRVCRIWESVQSGQFDEAMQLDRENSLCPGVIYSRLSSPLQNIVAQKYALTLLGVFATEGVLTDQRMDDEARNRVARALDQNRSWPV